MKGLEPQYVEMLKKYDSPTVCNVIEMFKIRPQNQGFLHHSIKALFPELPPMVGHAVTCTFRSAEPAETPPEYNDIGKHVEAMLQVPEPRVVVFKDLDEDPVGASFGEMVASTYMAFGCVGIITSGGARDTVVLRKKKLPLFAKSRNVSHAYHQCLEMNVPVEVGGVTIKPGDLLHGDADRVTTIPMEIAADVAKLGGAFIAAEKKWLDYVAKDNPTMDGLRAVIAEYIQFQRQQSEKILSQMGKTK